MKAFIITWDYKDQPEWEAVNESLQEFDTDPCSPIIFSVDSGSDQFAIVIAPIGTSQEEAQKHFDEHQFDECD